MKPLTSDPFSIKQPHLQSFVFTCSILSAQTRVLHCLSHPATPQLEGKLRSIQTILSLSRNHISTLVHKPDHAFSLSVAKHEVVILQVCQPLQRTSLEGRPEIGETLAEQARDQRIPARILPSLKAMEPYETVILVKELVEIQHIYEQEGERGRSTERKQSESSRPPQPRSFSENPKPIEALPYLSRHSRRRSPRRFQRSELHPPTGSRSADEDQLLSSITPLVREVDHRDSGSLSPQRDHQIDERPSPRQRHETSLVHNSTSTLTKERETGYAIAQWYRGDTVHPRLIRY